MKRGAYDWMPLYEVWTADRSNYTPLGLIVLYIPLLSLSMIATILMVILGVIMVALVLPYIGAENGYKWLDRRYAIDAKVEAGVCKLATGLKLLRRC